MVDGSMRGVMFASRDLSLIRQLVRSLLVSCSANAHVCLQTIVALSQSLLSRRSRLQLLGITAVFVAAKIEVGGCHQT